MKKYTLKVDDNYHHNPLEPDTYNAGEFASLEKALAKAKLIVDKCLRKACQPGMTAEELYEKYTSNGEDPYVIGGPPESDFSAWDYAQQRCEEICGKRRGARMNIQPCPHCGVRVIPTSDNECPSCRQPFDNRAR